MNLRGYKVMLYREIGSLLGPCVFFEMCTDFFPTFTIKVMICPRRQKNHFCVVIVLFVSCICVTLLLIIYQTSTLDILPNSALTGLFDTV